jgi:hypothetical protein
MGVRVERELVARVTLHGAPCSGQVKTDTQLSCLGEFFVYIRADIPKIRMFTPTVVEHLNIVDDVITGFLARQILTLRRTLAL